MPDLIVQPWHTECGECGHGRGGWAGSPARKGLPILTPDSLACPGCDVTFTHRVDPNPGTTTVLPRPPLATSEERP